MRAAAATAVAFALAGASLASPPRSAASTRDTFKVYRCTADDGRITLRDSPCPSGQAQEVRTMRTPKDAPPRKPVAETDAPPPAAPAPQIVERVVVVHDPRPMYACTTPDGDTYTSDTPTGNPRWVPLWTLGYPVPVQRGTRPPLAITGGTVEIDDSGVTLRRPGVGPRWMAGAGTWIRDTCHLLPQAEACDVLRDERDEIRRRFFNAMPSERDVLRVRERGVNARLDADCGGH